MDKISKFLRTLSARDRAMLKGILANIADLKLQNYDVKSLEGYKDFYRLRKGKIRILFTKQSNRGIIIDIAYRKDAYKHI